MDNNLIRERSIIINRCQLFQPGFQHLPVRYHPCRLTQNLATGKNCKTPTLPGSSTYGMHCFKKAV